MNTGNIVLGRFRKCCAGVAMGAMLVHSGEVVLNENKLDEQTYSETNTNEDILNPDQWLLLNELGASER